MACGCNNYTIKAESVRKSAGKQEKKNVKADKQTRSDVQCLVSTAEKTQKSVEAPANKSTKKRPDDRNKTS